MEGKDATTGRRGIAILFQLGPGDSPRAGGIDAARLARRIGQGYAAAAGGFRSGLDAVAGPGTDYGGRVVAALNLSVPQYRFASRPARAGAQLLVEAREMPGKPGGRPGRPTPAHG